jgi:hypothetical protein
MCQRTFHEKILVQHGNRFGQLPVLYGSGLRYAQETSWREDNQRISNGEQVSHVAGLAMLAKQSVDFCGYWQRHLVEKSGGRQSINGDRRVGSYRDLTKIRSSCTGQT